MYISKLDGENKIEVLLRLIPNNLAIWDQVDFLQMITPSFECPINGESASRNSDGNVVMIFSYQCSIQG